MTAAPVSSDTVIILEGLAQNVVIQELVTVLSRELAGGTGGGENKTNTLLMANLRNWPICITNTLSTVNTLQESPVTKTLPLQNQP